MITPQEEKAIVRQQLRDCIKQLGERAEELGEIYIAAVLYTLAGSIDIKNEHQLSEVTGTYAEAIKTTLAQKAASST